MIPYNKVTPTADQQYKLEVIRIGFMASCPFFSHYFYSMCQEYFTTDIPTAATDGRRIYINPAYIATLKPAEGVFVYAHEMYHAIMQHPQRMKAYKAAGKLGAHDYDQHFANQCADYCINADLVEGGIGMINSSWLWAPDVKGSDVWEEIYARKFPKRRPPQGGQGQGQSGPGNGPGQGQDGAQAPEPGETWGKAGKSTRGARTDAKADANGGGFDQVLEPYVDPTTGAEDLPSEAEFKEAIAKAAAAAKAMGKLPGNLARIIDEILNPQVDWKDHIRLLMTGKIGNKAETWDRPNRRFAALGALSPNPFPVLPGRRGFGAETVAVGIDTSGSVGPNELAAFLAEVGGILNDVRPKRIIVIGCDARVTQVEDVRNLDDLGELRAKGVKGGGGTSFVPVFEYLEKENVIPESLIYLTDMYGAFPKEAPRYPVIWAATTDKDAPWGDVVRIKV